MSGPNRRHVLRGLGLAGISVALPRLEAHAQGTRPKRLFVLHWPQGIPTGWNGSAGVWFPKEEGAAWTMTPCLKPLEPYRADINVVSGLGYKQIHQSSGSHGHAVAVFTGWKTGGAGTDKEASRGPSVQHIAGKVLSAGMRFGQIGTGLYSAGEGWWSWSAAGVKDSLELSPVALFNRLFSDVNVDPMAAAAAARRKKSVIDYVRADAADLQKALGREDLQRLDQHLGAVRDLETAITRVAPSTGVCTKPEKPGEPSRDYGMMADYARVMIRLQVMAQRCDLTRVSFMSLGGSQNYYTFPHLGITCDYHSVCHGSCSNIDRYKAIATFWNEQVAYLLGLLKADGGMGALLDDSVMVATSEFGDGGLHYDSYVPFVVAGKAGKGAAGMKTGNSLIFPCANSQGFQNGAFCATRPGTPNRCLNDLWQSALQVLGVLAPGQKYGDPALDTRPLEGLWV